MTAQGNPARNRGLLLKLLALAVVGGAVAILFLRGIDLKGLVQQVLAAIREMGPVAFFSALVVLPAFGVPLLAFVLTAGPVFAPKLGMPTVIGLVAAGEILNMALTYWLARYAFRPVLGGLIKRLGYQLPRATEDDYSSLIVLARVTPGIPFFAQGYLLGLAEVPFRLYMLWSTALSVPQAIALMLFADSLASGKGKLALGAFALIVAISVAIRWIRRRMSRRKAEQPA
jgi:uncharacterized membrane protein YdjX (TVP38/TMEM64 family)